MKRELEEEEAVFELSDSGPVPGDLTDRFLTCPVEGTNALGVVNGKRYTYAPADRVDYQSAGWERRIAHDWEALVGLVPHGVEILVIDIRRVAGVPHYLYLSNGTQQTPYETWSSSKFMVASAALARARGSGDGEIGGNARAGRYRVGDLITALHSYEEMGQAPGGVVASNAIGNYLLAVAGRGYATELLHDDWLRSSSSDSLSAGFGPFELDISARRWRAKTGGGTVKMKKRRYRGKRSKRMTALVQGEWLKRLTQHDTDPGTRLPVPGGGATLTGEDVRTLFYGDLDREGELGGMLAGPSVYFLRGLISGGVGTDAGNARAKKILDGRSGGKWRLFQKLGAGFSKVRRLSEITMAVYACLPGFDGGREVIIVTSAHRRGDLDPANAATVEAFERVVPLLVPGVGGGSPSRIE